MIQNSSEESYFPLGGFYYALLKGCYVASMNCGEVRCGPFILIQLNMEEYRRGIRVIMISVRPVEDSEGFCEEVSLNRVVSSNFSIGNSVNYFVNLCRLILDLEQRSVWQAE